MCTSPGGPGRSSYPLHELADAPAGRAGGHRADAPRQPVHGRLAGDAPRRHGPRRPDGPSGDRRTGRPSERRGEAEQLAARSGHDVWDRLPAIGCPTLVAGGRYDGIAPPANSEAIASRIAGADLRFYEGGHLFFMPGSGRPARHRGVPRRAGLSRTGSAGSTWPGPSGYAWMMSIAITDDHLALAGTVSDFLAKHQARAPPEPCSTGPRSRTPRSTPTPPTSAGSGCTSPSRSAVGLRAGGGRGRRRGARPGPRPRCRSCPR